MPRSRPFALIIDTDDTRGAELAALITLNGYTARVIASVEEANALKPAPLIAFASARVPAMDALPAAVAAQHIFCVAVMRPDDHGKPLGGYHFCLVEPIDPEWVAVALAVAKRAAA
jgi:hypothetical protein